MNVIKQNLPPLPLPTLTHTLERYLKSIKPFVTEDEYKVTEKLVNEFILDGGEGEDLQQYLQARVKTEENWLADLWLNYAYLGCRLPLPINSNTANLHPQHTVNSKSDQIAFAAAVIAGVQDFKQKLYSDGIPIQKLGPLELDMVQYYNFLGSCRIPGEKCDIQKFMDHQNHPKHVLVAHNQHFFSVPVYDENGKPLNQAQIVSQLEKVVAQSPEKSTFPVGILTSEHRDTWYKNYMSLRKDIINADNLDLIESSLFLLCLDGPKSPQELQISNPVIAGAFKMMHGGGSKAYSANRWFDKGIQIIIGENGEMGLNFEHSTGEGNPIAVLTDNVESYCSKFGGKDDPIPPANEFSTPKLLNFKESVESKKSIHEAFKNIDRIVNDFEVYTFTFTNYGKGFIKTQNVSPDSYFQMAMQYAFYRQYGKPSAQYESAATRIFHMGRTETIRSCSVESANFARAMLNPQASTVDKAQALKLAIKSHKEYVQMAVEGQGVDRHLLGLRLMALQHGMKEPEFFKDPAYLRSTNMRLSTSQVTNRSGAYGFFAPMVHDGYGCCYVIEENKIIIAMTAFHSNDDTDAMKFSQTLESCLNEIKSTLISAAAK